MAIRIRHDVAALGASLASGGSDRRKYGQQLVQQQRKYDMEQMQAMQDQLYDQQKMAMQNANALQQQAAARQKQQNALQTAGNINSMVAPLDAIGPGRVRDPRNVEMEQNEIKAFDQSRASMVKVAQDALAKGQFPPEIVPEVQKLIIGEAATRDSYRYSPQERNDYLNKMQARLSGLFEYMAPKKTAAEEFNEGVMYEDPVTGKRSSEFIPGARIFDPSGKEIPRAQKAPTTAREFYGANEANMAQLRKDLAAKKAEIQSRIAAGEAEPMSEEQLRQAALQAVEDDYNFVNSYASGQQSSAAAPAMPQPGMPAAPMGAPGVAAPAGPVQQQGVPQSTRTAIDDVLASFPSTEAMAMSGADRGSMIAAGMPQGTAPAPQTPQAPPVAMPTDRAGMVAAGMPQGGATATPVQQPPSQNPWEEFVSPPQQQASVQKTESAVAPSEATVSAPDFKKLSESATDSADKLVLGRLQSMYGSQPLDIQKAISAFVDPGSTEERAGQAIMYLKNKGIDILQLGKPRKRKLPGMSQ